MTNINMSYISHFIEVTVATYLLSNARSRSVCVCVCICSAVNRAPRNPKVILVEDYDFRVLVRLVVLLRPESSK